MARNRGIWIDENEAERKNEKNVLRKIAVAKDIKRAAFGELAKKLNSTEANKGKVGGRTVKNENGKKERSVTFKSSINLKSIKPRVDTHWKNEVQKIVVNSDSKKCKNGAVIQVENATGPNKGKVGRIKVENHTKKNGNGEKERSVTSKPSINLKSIKPRVDTHWKNEAKKNMASSDSKRCKNGAVIQDENATGLNKGKERRRAVKNDKIVNDAHQIIGKQKIANIRRDEKKKIRKKKEEKIETKAVKNVVVNKPDSTTSAVVPLFLEVENIDLDDSANPYLLSEYVNDIYDYLYELEAAFPIRENHLEDQVYFTPNMRSGVIDWINELHFRFHFAPDTYYMTVGIIDRYVQDAKTILRKYLKLVGVIALYIAAKVEEIYAPEIEDLIKITEDEYSNWLMRAMEREIVKTIGFQFGQPLSIHFLRRYFKAAKCIPLCHLMSEYFLELVTLEYSLCHYKPSEVAAASLLLTLILTNKEEVEISLLWTRTLKYYTKYSAEHLIPLVKKIACLVRDAPLSISPLFYTSSVVFIKYRSSKFEKVALRPELIGSRIKQLCAK